MELLRLVTNFKNVRLGERGHSDVAEIQTDSRLVKSDSLFVAIRGTRADGHSFLSHVCEQNVLGVVVESSEGIPRNFRGAIIEVPDTHRALAEIACAFYGNPSLSMFAVGVTGTNGKTTTTIMVEFLLQELLGPIGVIGTIDHHLGAKTWATQMTTPDALVLQSRMAEMLALGAKGVSMEVTSHALAQARVDGTHMDVAIFTNLTRDHLDYHGDMESYFGSKQRLFLDFLEQSSKPSKLALINIDDEWGRKLQISSQAKRWTYGQGDADFKFKILKMSFAGTEVELQTPMGKQSSFFPVVGLHNVQNMVAAIATACFAGCSLSSVLSRLQSFKGVKGRLQVVPNSNDIHVLVDYAHTDDGLRSVLSTLRKIRESGAADSKIIVVFGCGGDRDRGKRPLMMKAACEFADRVVVTSDNPRTEDPQQIIDDALVGAFSNANVTSEVDRRKAIQLAIVSAQPGDVVLIAGKGHENYQIVGDRRLPFDDFDVASEILGAL